MDNNTEPIIRNYRTYLTFTADHSVEQATAAFRARFGCEPERVYIGGSMLWVGPVLGGHGWTDRMLWYASAALEAVLEVQQERDG